MSEFLVSGNIIKLDNTPLSNIEVAFNGSTTPENVFTDENGWYTQSLPDVDSFGHWEGSIIPSDRYYSFSPSFRYYYTYLENQRTDFTASLINTYISGKITSSLGTNINYITMSFTNGISTVYTNTNGEYYKEIPSDWSGSICPTSSTYNFHPTDIYITASCYPKILNFMAVKNFSSGDGTVGSPYGISNYEDMYNIRFNKSSSTYYNLTSNIDLSYFNTFSPISGTFSSDFDGKNYTISNLNINQSVNMKYIGFFSILSSSHTFRNIKFDNCIVSISKSPSDLEDERVDIGLLCGTFGYATASNIKVVNSNIYYHDTTEDNVNLSVIVGGITGYSATPLYSCSVESSNLKLEATSLGEFSVIGGISGNPAFGHIKYSYIKDSLIYIKRPEFYAGTNRIGGISGTASTLFDCYVLNCTIESSGSTQYSVGLSYAGNLNRCYTSFDVVDIKSLKDNIYPVAYLESSEVDVYYESGAIEHRSCPDATGLTMPNMKISSSYINWDFENVWAQHNTNNNGYPYLRLENYYTPTTGLKAHYDSRLSYVSESNLLQDLSGNNNDSTTIDTYYKTIEKNLYFSPELGNSRAPINSTIISSSFAIEIWTAPTASLNNKVLFTTYPNEIPLISAYIDTNNFINLQSVYYSEPELIITNTPINVNKFNHIIFLVSESKGFIWLNGKMEASGSLNLSTHTKGGNIGISETNTNVYTGYIDVVKIWNGPNVDLDSINTYYSKRNYLKNLQPVLISTSSY